MSTVLFYMPSFAGGGTERVYVLMAGHLARNNHRVIVVVDRAIGPNLQLLPKQVEVRDIGSTVVSGVRALKAVLLATSPDRIFCGGGACPLKLALAVPRRLRKKVVITYHSLYRPNLGFGRKLTYWLAAVLSRWFGATTAVSADIRRQLAERFGVPLDALEIVPNPVDVELMRSLAKESLPPSTLLPAGGYIVTSGRLVPEKDFPTLIQGYAKVAGQISQDLVLLGDGPLRRHLEELVVQLGVESRVHFFGYMANPFPVIQRADLFALTSQTEGFGNVLLEAMALGTPVVCTDCPGGPREIVESAALGDLISVGDADAFAAAVVSRLALERETQRLVSRAMEFDIGKVVQRYMSACAPARTKSDMA